MTETTNMVTTADLEALKAELEELEQGGRREIAERIKVAREWGDLKENSEYHDAKNDQAHLETRIARLREKISGAVVVEQGVGAQEGEVGFGSSVLVRDQNGSRAHLEDRQLPRRRARRGPSLGRVARRTRPDRHPRRSAGRGLAAAWREPAHSRERELSVAGCAVRSSATADSSRVCVNAATTVGSNCVPAHACSSTSASAPGIAPL